MPKAAAIDCLAQSIAKMPLSPQALAETFATAASLVKLLPVQARRQGVSATGGGPTVRELAPTALLCLSLIFGLLINAISDRASIGTANATTPTAQIADPDQTTAVKPFVTPTVDSGRYSPGPASDVTHVRAP